MSNNNKSRDVSIGVNESSSLLHHPQSNGGVVTKPAPPTNFSKGSSRSSSPSSRNLGLSSASLSPSRGGVSVNEEIFVDSSFSARVKRSLRRNWRYCSGLCAYNIVIVNASLLLISAVGNSLFFKKMVNAMPNYTYFINQFTGFLYLPVFFSMVLYELYVSQSIKDEVTTFPKYKFFIMGIFDAVSGLMMMFGALHTSGSLSALLSNGVIPITMVLSTFILGTRYRRNQYLGSAIILTGIGVVLAPKYLNAYFADPLAPTPPPAPSGDSPFYNALFIMSLVPLALSSIYKEVAFGDVDMSVNYLQFWVVFFQFMITICLIPIQTLPIMGPDAISFDQLLPSLRDGWYCFTGYNVRPNDTCEGAWFPLAVFFICNIAFNFFTMTVIKQGGAALMFVIMTLRLPLVQIAFAIPAINYPPDQLSWSTGCGLIFIITGLVAYKWKSSTAEAEATESEDESGMVPAAMGFAPMYTAMRATHALGPNGVSLKKDSKVLRNTLYASIGIINSPATPRTLERKRNNGPNLPAPGPLTPKQVRK